MLTFAVLLKSVAFYAMFFFPQQLWNLENMFEIGVVQANEC